MRKSVYFAHEADGKEKCIGFIVESSNFAPAKQQLQSSTSIGRMGKPETKVFSI